jgi:hypothetical protein
MDAKYFYTPGNPAGGMGGLARASVYCRGTLDVREDSTTVSGGSRDMSGAITDVYYTPMTVGAHLLRTDLDIADCSMFVSSYEIIDNDVYQCIYPNTGALTNKNVAGDPIPLNIVSGPVFTAGSVGNVLVPPSTTFTITVPLNNIGDTNATITSVGLTSGSTVITVNSFSPTVINVSQPANFVINATAPAAIGNYSVQMSIAYTSSLVALGNCANNTQTGISLNTTIVVGDNTPPVTTITGIQSDGSGYQFNTTAFLPPPLNLTLSCNDGTGFGCNTTYYCIAESSSGACSNNPSTINTIYTQQYNVTKYGTYTTCFYSNDLAGNNETPKCETIIIEEPKALSVHVTATPSGILKDENGLHPTNNVSINVSITRNNFLPLKVYKEPQFKNITIYRLNATNPDDRTLMNKSEENSVDWNPIPDPNDDSILAQVTLATPLSIDVSPSKYIPAVYQVEATMYDPLMGKNIVPASTYFVIYRLDCADKG